MYHYKREVDYDGRHRIGGSHSCGNYRDTISNRVFVEGIDFTRAASRFHGRKYPKDGLKDCR